MGIGRRIMNWEQDFVDDRVMATVKRADFDSDRISFILLRCRWFRVIVLNVHAPTEDKTDDVKDRLYDELQSVRRMS
jgi:hypothetical protein